MKIFNESLTGPILSVVLALSLFGIMAVLSASVGRGAVSPEYSFNSLFFFERQATFLILGLGAMWAIKRWLNLEFMRPLCGVPLVLFTCALLVWALCSGSVNEVHRWISVGGFRFQPGELAKITMIMFWAGYLVRRRKALLEAAQPPLVKVGPGGPLRPQPMPSWGSWEWWKVQTSIAYRTFILLLPALGVTGVVLLLIELGKDLGTIFVIVCTIGCMIIAAGASWQFLGGSVLLAVLGVVAMIAKEPYRIMRIVAWLDPLADKAGSGYQVYNSFIAIGSGGLWGVGMPFSRQKFEFLPEMHCDFIYAVICEELGLVGSLGLVLLFFVLATCCVAVATRCKDPYLSMVSLGISMQVVGQALFNMAVVTGLAPNKGLPLPFVSSGGSSLFLTLVSMGILLNISDRVNSRPVKAQPKLKKKRPPRQGATISSSSEEVKAASSSSGEWEAVVSTRRGSPPPCRLPKPAIDPAWGRILPFEPGSRAERERLRRLQSL